jgi:hypothetical protein
MVVSNLFSVGEDAIARDNLAAKAGCPTAKMRHFPRMGE